MAAPDWMAAIPNNGLLLRELTMPGSHDAGVSLVHNSGKGLPCPSSWYICQSQDIAGQLNSGARFFDVRFAMKNGVATTVHETAGNGGWGESAASIFSAIANHLRNYNQEIIIVRVSHTDAQTAQAVHATQTTRINQARYLRTDNARNLANTPIRALRGKAIIAYASDAIANPIGAQGQIRFGKATKAGRGGIVTCGEYPNSNDMDLIRYKSVKRTNEHRLHNCNNHSHGDHLFMLYWQMTGGNVQGNTTAGGFPPPAYPPPQFNAHHGTHYNLTFLLRMLRGSVAGTVTHGHLLGDSAQTYPPFDANRCQWVPNIINLDFVCDEVCDPIIAFNRSSLTAAGKWVIAP